MSDPKEDVFTPLNTDGERLRFPLAAVRIISGTLWARGRGIKAEVEIYGQQYAVHGRACSAPNCWCDAVIKPIKPRGIWKHRTGRVARPRREDQ